MDGVDKRKFKRYDAFIQVNLFVPPSLEKSPFEVTGWIKNISQGGMALEIYISSADEIEPLQEIVTNKEWVSASIQLQDGSTLKAGCEIVWGAFLASKRLYTIGLQILEIDQLQRNKWDSFIEKLSQ